MHKLKKSEKDAVRNFVSVTECSEKVAIDMLKAAEWSVPTAVELYYARGHGPARSGAGRPSLRVDAGAVEALWRKFKDPGSEMILADGVSRLCDELGVDPGDVGLLVLAYHFGAACACEFTKDEWTAGCAALGCDSTAKLAAKLPGLRASLGDGATFRAVYAYAFGFGRDKGAKVLLADTAVALWALLLPACRWHAADKWLAFFPTCGAKVVSKDTWMQVLEFVRTVKPDLSNHDPEGAWPSVIDDFVEVLRAPKAA